MELYRNKRMLLSSAFLNISMVALDNKVNHSKVPLAVVGSSCVKRKCQCIGEIKDPADSSKLPQDH